MEKVLLKGNEALAEAAVAAGCRFYSGYPITPQTEILEYLSWRMEEAGGVFIQAESELSGIFFKAGRDILSGCCGSSGGDCRRDEDWNRSRRYFTGAGGLLAADERRRSWRLPDDSAGAGIRTGKCGFDG